MLSWQRLLLHVLFFVGLAAGIGIAPRASWALISQPSLSAEGTGPRTATVLWDVPSEAGENGDKIISTWEFSLADNFSFADASTATRYGSTYFYTGIGKIKNLRTINKTQDSVTLKWDKTVREDDSMTYEVKVYRKTKLILDDSVFGKGYLTIEGN